MGVPVVSLLGKNHVARVGGSLLKSIGHSEWIASDWKEYGEIAADLARDRDRLQNLRSGLRSEMRDSPLLDHHGQTSRFADALRSCWVEWCEKCAVGGGVNRSCSE